MIRRPSSMLPALAVAVMLVVGCAATAPPSTFSQRLAVADISAAAIGRTCVDLSARDRLPIDTLIRCRAVVAEAGNGIDTARALGELQGNDRLLAAQQLLLDLERDIRAREAP